MWIIIISTIISLILIHWMYNEFFGYWKRRGVPHPRTSPLIGNMSGALTLKKNLGCVYTDMYNNFKDCLYVGYYKMQQPALLIRDVELVKTIAIKEFSSFHDNDMVLDESNDPIFAKISLFLKGQRWKVARGQMASALTTSKIRNVFNSMSAISKNLVTLLNEEIKTGDGIEGKKLFSRYTADIGATCAFGLEGDALSNSESELQFMSERLFDTSLRTIFKHFLLFIAPSLHKFLGLSFAPKDATNWFSKTLQQAIEYRETNNIVRNDYLGLMISFKSTPGEFEFTDKDVIAQAVSFFTGGYETSATALNFVLYALATNPDVQTKLQDEIDKALRKCNGEITYEELHNMNYLDMVVLESMRKYPPGLALSKVCTKEFTLPPAKGEGTGCNVVLETGTPIVIPIHAIHMDPTYYPEPEKFIPERFSEEGKQSRPKCAYLPFGEGPRKCLGFRFAMIQVKLPVISILSNFNVKLNSKTTPTFEIVVQSLTMSKKGGVWLNFDKRTN